MSGYAPDSPVTVRPFTHRVEGDAIILGDIDRHVFLAIPAEGLDILTSLAAGKTVGEAARLYEEKYHETPDIVDFLEALEQEGFIGEAAAGETGDDPQVRESHWRWRLGWLTPRVAQGLVSWPVLAVCGVLIAFGVGLMIDDPRVIPTGGNVLLFPKDFAALTWATFLLAVVGMFVHELSHVVAARAAGIPAGIGVGNQLWIVVAQTDMTGIWMAPKRRRYIAFVIGAIVDAVTVSFLAGFLWLAHRGWIGVPDWSPLLAKALMFTTLARIIWQFFFYLRTDGYYVIATAFNCKNLMVDTDNYVRNLWAGIRRLPQRVDQSGIPARRDARHPVVLAAVVLRPGRLHRRLLPLVLPPPVGLRLPARSCWLTGSHSRFSSFDFATVGMIALVIDGGGLVMWLRGLYRGAKARHRASQALRAEAATHAPEPVGDTARVSA